MRGIFSYARTIANEVREFGWAGALENIRADWRDIASDHFANHIGGSLSGVFIRLPYTRLSAWLGWSEVNCGIGAERSEGSIQVWVGKLDMWFCREPNPSSAETF